MRWLLLACVLVVGCSRPDAEQQSQQATSWSERAENEIKRLQQESKELGAKGDDGMDVFTDLFVRRQRQRAAGDPDADRRFVERVEGKSLLELAPKR